MDTNVQKLGIRLASSCVCCINSKQESLSHLFCHSYLASSLWDYFSPPLKINTELHLSKASDMVLWFVFPNSVGCYSYLYGMCYNLGNVGCIVMLLSSPMKLLMLLKLVRFQVWQWVVQLYALFTPKRSLSFHDRIIRHGYSSL